jgi:photosystem II stability/assembly factor-like uncharacterized protein
MNRYASPFAFLALICVEPASSQGIWTPLNGPVAVELLCVDKAPDGTIYAGTFHDGVLTSTNGGSDWFGETRKYTKWCVKSVAAPSGRVLYTIKEGGEFLTSVDAGETWSPIHSEYSNPTEVLSIGSGEVAAVDHKDRILLLGGPGKQWTTVPFPPFAERYTESWLHFVSDHRRGIYFSSTFEGVYRLDRRKKTWKHLAVPIPIPHTASLAFGPNGALYEFAMNKIWRLDRTAHRWNEWMSLESEVTHVVFEGGRTIAIITNTPGVHISEDAGRTWRQSTWGVGAATVAFFSQPRTIVVGTEDNGVFRSSDLGDHWTSVRSGLLRTNLKSLVVLRNGTLVCSMFDISGVYRSIDGGMNWSHIHPDPQQPFRVIALHVASDDLLFAGTLNHGVYRSRDAGMTWARTLNANRLGASFDSRNAEYITLATDDGAFSSRDSGSSWNPIGLSGQKVFCVRISGDALVASGPNMGIVRSTDWGHSWSKVSPAPVHWIIGCPGYLAAGFYPQFMKSTDDGQTWSITTVDSGKPNLTTLAVDTGGGIWMASTAEGLYHSTDAGISWTRYREGMPTVATKVSYRNPNIDVLTGDPSKALIPAGDGVRMRGVLIMMPDAHGGFYAGVEDRGLYEVKLSRVGGEAAAANHHESGQTGTQTRAQRGHPTIPFLNEEMVVHEIAPGSVNNVLQFRVLNYVPGISSDQLALMLAPSGLERPEINSPPHIMVNPPLRGFVLQDSGSTRVATFMFDAPASAIIGRQDTLVFIIMSRLGPYAARRVIFRYGDHSGSRDATGRPSAAMISEEIAIRRR